MTASLPTRRAARALLWLLGALTTAGCNEPKHFSTTVELLQVRRFGQGTGMVDLEMRYADCPGDARRIMRGDKTFAACATDLKKGDRLQADLVQTYSSERGMYQSDLVKLGACDVHLDLKDEANYELFQDCKDLMASGIVVGVHCNRRREGELLEKCPWMRRR